MADPLSPEEELIALCAGAVEPVLNENEIATCLIQSAVPDADGLYLDSEDWTPTYDMNRAAAKAWRMKAAKVAAMYSVTVEGRELNRGQMIDNFLRQASEFAKLAQPRYFSTQGESDPWRV